MITSCCAACGVGWSSSFSTSHCAREIQKARTASVPLGVLWNGNFFASQSSSLHNQARKAISCVQHIVNQLCSTYC
jgi:hypothetical protein